MDAINKSLGKQEPKREKAVSEKKASDHPYQSGERTFTEPDNPPSRSGSSRESSRSADDDEQQTGGPDKPTA